MSYQEKNVMVSLVSHVMILGYYVLNVLQMLQDGGLVAARLFGLSAVIILAGISVNIVGSILTNIVLSIVEVIQTKSKEPITFTADERDQLISLKGMRVEYVVFSLGVLAAMLTFVFGQSPLVMFGLIILSGNLAQVIGDATRIYLYRRGV